MKTTLSSVASLLTGLALCAALVAYGVTEEVPVGGVEGVVLMKENGKPLAKAMVTIRSPEDSKTPMDPRLTVTDDQGKFRIRNVLAGTYKIEVSGKAHVLELKDDVIVPEGRPVILELEANPTERYLDLYASQRVFMPSESAELQIKGFVTTDDLKLSAYRLRFDEVAKEGSLYNALAPLSGRYQKAKDPTTMGDLALERIHKISNKDAEGTFVDTISVGELPEGIYWVQCSSGSIVRGTWFSVSRVAMVVKNAGQSATCFVTRIDTGEAVGGVEIGESVEGRYVQRGFTSPDGLLDVKTEKAGGTAVLIASFGASKALVDFYASQTSTGPSRAYVYTDRPIYRPGDQVQYKGILRKLDGSQYRLPPQGQVEVDVLDGDDTLLSRQQLTLSDLGTYSGSHKLSPEASPDSYRIVTRYDDNEFSSEFSVATYRKPAYNITVRPSKPQVILGERAVVEVKAEYYFGGPVVGAEVTAYVSRNPSWDPRLWGDDYEDWWSEDSEGYGGDYVADLTAKTDAEGVARFEIDTRPTTSSEALEYDYSYSVNATVVDEAGKYFDGNGSFKVVRGEFSLRVDTSSYVVAPGDAVEVEIKALQNIESASIQGTELRLAAGYEVWDRAQVHYSEQSVQTVALNPNGEASATLRPETPGSYVIKAEARDARGNIVRATAYVWVYRHGMQFGSAQEGIQASLDKRQYKIGESAKLLITTDSPGGHALVTTEGDGIYSRQTVRLEGSTTMVELPVRPVHLPNAYVSIAYVKDKSFSEVSRSLRVDTSVRELNIKVTTPKEDYAPGDTITYQIETADPKGMPVSAECSLGVVDESIYALARDQTDLISAFYPRRYNAVQTNFSFPELYLDGGDKAPTSIQVRRNFRDTAYWNPIVRTDASGKATVTVTLPDNLTSWRATVAGVSQSTDVGLATTSVRSSKPLMVRLEGPPSLVVGDSISVRALVTNNTGADATVKVQIGGEGAAFDGDKTKSAELRPGSTQNYEWTANIATSGSVKFVAKAWIEGGASDGVELKVPVAPHGRTFVDRWTGETKGTGDVTVVLRDGADKNVGSLLLTVTPTLGSAFVQSLDKLIGYPYGCVEQTMSRFLPTVVVAHAMKEAGLAPPVKAAEIPDMVTDGITRLRRMQHEDGGWGWWEHDDSDLYMTGYVLEGAYLAEAAGFSTRDLNVEKALGWAKKALAVEPKQAEQNTTADRLYVSYSLALHGERDAALKELKRHDVSKLNAIEATYATLASYTLGAAHHQVTDACLARLKSTARETGGTANWTEGYWGVETTARALFALTKASPQSPLISKAVRYLMFERRGDMWFSTRDTAIALLALSQVWEQTGELKLSGDLLVSLNGTQIALVKLDSGILSKPDTRLEIPVSELLTGENKLTLTRTDGGPAYYSAQLRQTVTQQSIGRIVNADGLQIDRSYYRLRTTRLEDGTMRLQPERDPTLRFSVGDVLRCEIKVSATTDRSFLMIEDPIPAGFVVTERTELDPYEEWDNWWARSVAREDRMAFFMDFVPAGTHVLSYHLRAETPGRVQALPSLVSQMYDPQTHAGSPESKLEVVAK